MWTKVSPYLGILLLFVILLSITEFTNAMSQKKPLNVVTHSETKRLIRQKAEIEMYIDKGVRRIPSPGLSKVNYMRQSLNNITVDPFIDVEMEAPGISHVDCVWVTLRGNTSQSIHKCGGWNGSAVVISIPHAAFRPELEELSIIIISETNSTTKELVDISGIDFNTTAFETTIGFVGSNPWDSNAFVRVQVGNDEEPVEVGGKTCVQGKICYYPYSGESIEERVKEIEVYGLDESSYTINQYDDSIMPFKELDGNLSVSYSEEGVIHVSTTMSEENFVLELVVYDENDPQNIVSKDQEYKCKVNRISKEGYSCSQEIQVTKELKSVWVLVVRIGNDNRTVLQSTRRKIPINSSDGVEVWVIVVSVIGGLCAVILIAAAVFFTWKKQSNRTQKADITSQADNVTMGNTTNSPKESCYENVMEIQIEDEKKTSNDNEAENQ